MIDKYISIKYVDGSREVLNVPLVVTQTLTAKVPDTNVMQTFFVIDGEKFIEQMKTWYKKYPEDRT